ECKLAPHQARKTGETQPGMALQERPLALPGCFRLAAGALSMRSTRRQAAMRRHEDWPGWRGLPKAMTCPPPAGPATRSAMPVCRPSGSLRVSGNLRFAICNLQLAISLRSIRARLMRLDCQPLLAERLFQIVRRTARFRDTILIDYHLDG